MLNHLQDSAPCSHAFAVTTKDEVWQGLAADGIITAEEVDACTFANYYRTTDEFCHPLRDASSAASRAGLKLVSDIEYRSFFVASIPGHLEPTSWISIGVSMQQPYIFIDRIGKVAFCKKRHYIQVAHVDFTMGVGCNNPTPKAFGKQRL